MREVERCQLIVVAMQSPQLRTVGDVERCEIVVGAVEVSEFRTFADVQAGECVVLPASHTCQLDVLREVEGGQMVVGGGFHEVVECK